METTARQQLKKHMGFDSPSIDYTKIAHILWGSVSGAANREAAARGLVEYLKTADADFNAEEFTKILTTGKNAPAESPKGSKKAEDIFTLVKKGTKVSFKVPAGVYADESTVYTIWKSQDRNYCHAWWTTAWDNQDSWGPWVKDEAYTVEAIEKLAAYYRK